MAQLAVFSIRHFNPMFDTFQMYKLCGATAFAQALEVVRFVTYSTCRHHVVVGPTFCSAFMLVRRAYKSALRMIKMFRTHVQDDLRKGVLKNNHKKKHEKMIEEHCKHEVYKLNREIRELKQKIIHLKSTIFKKQKKIADNRNFAADNKKLVAELYRAEQTIEDYERLGLEKTTLEWDIKKLIRMRDSLIAHIHRLKK